jgi:hypothetical protein
MTYQERAGAFIDEIRAVMIKHKVKSIESIEKDGMLDSIEFNFEWYDNPATRDGYHSFVVENHPTIYADTEYYSHNIFHAYGEEE